MRALAAAAILAAAVACDEAPFGPDDVRNLQRAEQRWEARGFDDYSFQIRRFCFCAPEYTEWAMVEVRGGAIAAVTVGDTLPIAAARLDEWPTVEALFRTIRSTASGDWVEDVAVDYDADLGYPRSITATAEPGILDGGLTIETRHLNPLP